MATGNKLLLAQVGWSNKYESGLPCHTTGCHAKQLKRNKRIAGKILRNKLKAELRYSEI